MYRRALEERKDVGRHAQDRNAPDQDYEQREHRDEVRITQGQPHHDGCRRTACQSIAVPVLPTDHSAHQAHKTSQGLAIGAYRAL